MSLLSSLYHWPYHLFLAVCLSLSSYPNRPFLEYSLYLVYLLPLQLLFQVIYVIIIYRRWESPGLEDKGKYKINARIIKGVYYSSTLL